MSEPGTEPTDGTNRATPVGLGLGFLGIMAAFAGVSWVQMGTTLGIQGGILLIVLALGFLAVAIGGHPYGPDVEGALDLSSRLGLGLLGGVLGGLAHGVATEVMGSVELTLLLGVGIDVDLSAGQYLLRAVYGGAWGLGLGLLYPLVPGATFAGKGAIFSLLPSLYTLLVVYPVFLGLGLLGVRQGFLTFPLVLIGNAVAGMVAAWVIAWGRETDVAPVSAALVD
jgi:hypothetical protein